MATSINLGGVWHDYTPFINIAGVWHACSLYLNVGGVWKALSAVNFTLNAASIGIGNAGYQSGSGGSISPVVTVKGAPIYALRTDSSTGDFYLALSGFGANPGSAFIKSLIINGLTLLASSVAYFDYGVLGAGIARWSWAVNSGVVAGGSYPTTINL